MKHVVAFRPLKLGDFLVVVPALRAVRRAWPEHELVFATNEWLRPVVELAGCVDTLLPTHGMKPLDERYAHPDVAVNLHGTGPHSTAVLDALEPRRRIGHSGHGWPGPEWLDDIHERERWCRMLRAHGIPADPDDFLLRPPPVPSPAPGAVLVHPGAAYGSKRWPLSRYADVVRELRGEGCRVVLTGSAAERELAMELATRTGLPHDDVLAGDTDLSTLAALVAAARLVVSGDTGIAHLAYAYRTPSVTLFGPVSARHWGPPADGRHRALSADADRRGDPFAAEPDPALLGVSTAEVIAAAVALLGSPTGGGRG
ncbi:MULTISPECIES: glycosyltransferase family 9 protein [Amycolatopsis]|uniref:Glycosyltransferase family 9 protein n=1 Tax=Amycolatopsis dongchuanensis TaxID=1070866 RepID=A0ABP8VCF6_9PSEU